MTKDEMVDLISDAGFGFLATVDGSQPRVRPVGPYLTDENKLLIALFAHRRSIPQMESNPLVEICFVDRKMSYCRLTGTAKVTNSKDGKELIWNGSPMLKQYFSGPDDPNFSLVEIEITAAEAMTASDKEPQEININ